MFEIGYKLCSEEQSPQELIECAVQAEEVGFDFAMISDHYHPWVSKQGQSGFEVISKFKKALKHSVQVVFDEKDSDECAI
jgi:alkanesulfonate monooxygenase SsuD/methylene tetrahydromethanopterin reductase-like flavin-dependent oxidoreductase (luciferase family)